jgi:hypothetical protein
VVRDCRAGGLILYSFCTMGISVSAPDSQVLGQFFSQISMATSPSLYIKVVVLHTSYKSTIGIKLS